MRRGGSAANGLPCMLGCAEADGLVFEMGPFQHLAARALTDQSYAPAFGARTRGQSLLMQVCHELHACCMWATEVPDQRLFVYSRERPSNVYSRERPSKQPHACACHRRIRELTSRHAAWMRHIPYTIALPADHTGAVRAGVQGDAAGAVPGLPAPGRRGLGAAIQTPGCVPCSCCAAV
jgi:hypothetical protein